MTYAPLVLLAYVVLLAQIDEVYNGFGGDQMKIVDDLDLI